MTYEPLHEKFRAERTDPEAQEKHKDCFLFVLDPAHDPAARQALLSYVSACYMQNPELAQALMRILRELPE